MSGLRVFKGGGLGLGVCARLCRPSRARAKALRIPRVSPWAKLCRASGAWEISNGSVDIPAFRSCGAEQQIPHPAEIAGIRDDRQFAFAANRGDGCRLGGTARSSGRKERGHQDDRRAAGSRTTRKGGPPVFRRAHRATQRRLLALLRQSAVLSSNCYRRSEAPGGWATVSDPSNLFVAGPDATRRASYPLPRNRNYCRYSRVRARAGNPDMR